MSAYWFSPVDMAGWTLLASVSLVLVVGLAPWPATYVLLTVTFLAVFQHTNIRTPRWLGYLIQRPEAHSHHHGRGVHWDNFADLPVFDMVFGTFRNPRGFADATGFYDGASYRVGEMVAMKDVSTPKQDRAPLEPTRFVPSSAN
jgi:sterol desaturase/sphingolipid hydroxylase (fatty acid hydroxylase superfamily)